MLQLVKLNCKIDEYKFLSTKIMKTLIKLSVQVLLADEIQLDEVLDVRDFLHLRRDRFLEYG